MKRTIGLTGNSGAGKSTVAEYLRGLGAEIIDADKISHDLCETGQQGYVLIRDAFGEQFFCEDGSLDRRALGSYVFANKDELLKLNGILHPLIIAEVENRKKIAKSETVVIDCALLIEVGLHHDVDEVWLVEAEQTQKKERIRNRDGIDEVTAKNRISNQLTEDILKQYADVVIVNTGTLCKLEKQVEEAYYGKNKS